MAKKAAAKPALLLDTRAYFEYMRTRRMLLALDTQMAAVFVATELAR